MKAKEILINRLINLGFSYPEACQLRRIQMALHNWDEAECGDSNDRFSRSLERDEVTQKPYWVIRYHNENKERRYPTPDREKGALKRLGSIMASHPDFAAYHQSDCRGCALYVVRVADIPAGAKLDSCYNLGLAICD
jgi:hypothetical protein